MKYSFALPLATLILIGCSAIRKDDSDLNLFESASIKKPFEILETYHRKDGSVAYTNYADISVHRLSDDVLVEAYLNSALCSPSLTGTSSPIPLGPGEWGEVDAFDTRDQYGNWPEGFDFRVNNDIVCKKPLEAASVYSFCSEKDGKTVVICISQMKDDPQMAEEIFKTFQWTE